MIRFVLRLLLFMTPVLIFSGCKKEDPNPELKDPIFKDLDRRATEHQKTYEEVKEKIAELRSSIAKTEPRTIDLKNLKRELEKEQKLLRVSEEQARYYRIRAQRRKLTGRIAYQKTFAERKT